MSDNVQSVNTSDSVLNEQQLQNENLLVTADVTHSRLKYCLTCENNVLDVIPKCNQCDCSISLLTTLSFKTCPVEKW
jgi:hypothetical protein